MTDEMGQIRDQIIDVIKKYKEIGKQLAYLDIIEKKLEQNNKITSSDRIVLERLISRKKVTILRESTSKGKN